MRFRTGLGAPTIAFEPLPVNNFYFTTSVLANPGMRERLKLYQHGLGNASARVDMYSDPQNLSLIHISEPTRPY